MKALESVFLKERQNLRVAMPKASQIIGSAKFTLSLKNILMSNISNCRHLFKSRVLITCWEARKTSRKRPFPTVLHLIYTQTVMASQYLKLIPIFNYWESFRHTRTSELPSNDFNSCVLTRKVPHFGKRTKYF